MPFQSFITVRNQAYFKTVFFSGWNRRHSALHYLQLAKMLNPSGASARLASSEVMSVNNTWTDLNELKRFLCAFLVGNAPKRALSD